MVRKLVVFVVLVLIAASVKGQDKIALTEIANGFNIPVGIVNVGDDRLFVVEKPGYIRIMDTTGQLEPTPFLDIDAKVNSVQSERGLLGLAFHPAYADNGYFFVDYTNNSGNTVIARYTRDAADPNLADPNSEMILMTVTQPYTNHNGGQMAFGPDGYLYIGFGDGGNGGDPGDRAQNGQERLGKILRVDVDGALPFDIPADNPFVGIDSMLPEIWALGLRNPWRFSFDRQAGHLWIADVGQDAWEEIDFQEAGTPGGQNYGWRCKEGLQNFNTSGCPSNDAFTDPVYVYAHTASSCSGSVTGGYVYRGSRNPYLSGKYVFVDYCTGVFRAITRDEGGNIEAEVLADLQNGQFTSFGEDASGEVYVTAGNGRIYRIEDIVSAVSAPHIIDASIMPNPTTGTFSFVHDKATVINYSIHDIRGRVLMSGVTDKSVNCAVIPAGIYFVEWSVSGGDPLLSKLVITR